MNVLDIKTRNEFYEYLKNNHLKEKECFVYVKLGNPNNINGSLAYLDAVEIALCFGWIDSTKKVIDGKILQRFSPRKKNSNWTILNIARVKRLIKTKEMTEYGLKVCKDLNKEYIHPKRIINTIKLDKEAYLFFISTPKLYQDIRVSYIASLKDKKDKRKALTSFIKKCHEHKMYGAYDDYGRLLMTKY